jgi:hypothetical protein
MGYTWAGKAGPTMPRTRLSLFAALTSGNAGPVPLPIRIIGLLSWVKKALLMAVITEESICKIFKV